MFWLRQHARFVFAENAIAIARHNLIDRIPKSSRQQTTCLRQTPNTTELGQHVKNRIRARQQSFIALVVVFHDIDRVEVVRVYAVTRHQALRKFALQRRKPETIALISFQQELNETVTESANSVVENDWVGVRSRHNTSDRAK